MPPYLMTRTRQADIDLGYVTQRSGFQVQFYFILCLVFCCLFSCITIINTCGNYFPVSLKMSSQTLETLHEIMAERNQNRMHINISSWRMFNKRGMDQSGFTLQKRLNFMISLMTCACERASFKYRLLLIHLVLSLCSVYFLLTSC